MRNRRPGQAQPVGPDELWERWNQLSAEMRDQWRLAVSEATGLPAGRVRVLRRLGRGPMTLSELANATGSDAPATTVAVNDLEGRGLVVRDQHPTNRRAKLVSLTRAGQAAVAKVFHIMASPPAAFTAISAADRAALGRVIDALSPPATDEDDGRS